MNSKKPTAFGADDDPLSSMSTSTPFVKKVPPKNVFERVIQDQEKDLAGPTRPVEKKTTPGGFVVNKSTHVNIGVKDAIQPNLVAHNPFKASPRVPAQQEQIKPREIIFPNQQKKPEPAHAQTPHNPFDDPKVQAAVKNVEEKLKASPTKPQQTATVHPTTGPKETIKLTNVDLVPGEKPLVSVSCFITLNQYPHLSTDGILIISNYQLIFKPADDNYWNKKPKLRRDYLHLPLAFIHKFDKSNDKRSFDVVFIEIQSKDGRVFKIRLPERYGTEIMQYLNVYAFPDRKDHFFAIEYGKANRELEDRFKGWKIYDIEKEFKRQGCDFAPSSESDYGNHLFRLVDNKDFRICSTYPPKLLIPAKISDSGFYASSRFRTKERVPALTYYYAKTKAVLARSSQSKPGLYQSRCLEDEQLLRYLGNPHLNDIGDTGVTDVNLYIYDARPYLNAMANRVNGKGFEDTKWYRNCEIFFMDIDNIHHVRDSHRKLLNMCHSPDTSNLKWYSQLESSNWLELMSFIIGAAIKVASSLRNGKSCLVHCSDGWDRTAQILSLAQIMLDPYFRTIEGFQVLIMKDWVYFGHQFNMRMGHGSKNEKDDQKSPVFLQFLDCIHQLIHQYPFAFEFNQKFLTDLAYHAYSCKFGLFLCNSYKEIVEYKMEERTVSLWSYLNAQKDRYYNIYYHKSESQGNSMILKPSHHLKHLRLWEEHFLSYSWLAKPQYELAESITFATDFHEHMLMKDRKKVRELKAEVEDLKMKLKMIEAKGLKIGEDAYGNPIVVETKVEDKADSTAENQEDTAEAEKQKSKKDKKKYKELNREGPAPELTHSETITLDALGKSENQEVIEDERLHSGEKEETGKRSDDEEEKEIQGNNETIARKETEEANLGEPTEEKLIEDLGQEKPVAEETQEKVVEAEDLDREEPVTATTEEKVVETENISQEKPVAEPTQEKVAETENISQEKPVTEVTSEKLVEAENLDKDKPVAEKTEEKVVETENIIQEKAVTEATEEKAEEAENLDQDKSEEEKQPEVAQAEEEGTEGNGQGVEDKEEIAEATVEVVSEDKGDGEQDARQSVDL